MIRHLLALTWNRRRTNLLLMVEIFVAFMALVAVSTLGAWGLYAHHRGRGYSLDGVWKVHNFRIEGKRPAPEDRLVVRRQAQRVFAAAAALPEVVAVAGMEGGSPYGSEGNVGRINDREYRYIAATDTLPQVLSIELTRGRWFGPQDDAAGHRPVVINEDMARAYFGGADPLGRRLPPAVDFHVKELPSPPRDPRPRVVVGVIRYYRSDDPFRGDYGGLGDLLFERLRLDAPPRDGLAMLLKLRPGTTAAFEESLTRAIKAVGRDLDLAVMRYDQRQARALKQALGAIAILGVLAGFLLVMVALGLSGVVWQSVTRRTAEIGLRRAQGATAGDIRRQFLGEFLCIATLAMAPGALVVVNFAGVIAHVSYFDVGWVPSRVYLAAFAFSVLAIYVLVSAACYIPSRLAARVQPLAALRHE